MDPTNFSMIKKWLDEQSPEDETTQKNAVRSKSARERKEESRKHPAFLCTVQHP
jgi:hypothetical protein